MRKDLQSGRGTNLRMDDNTYKLRRQVIDIIYQAKNVLRNNGIALPRLDVRIITTNEANRHVLGVARLNDNIVWISTDTLTKYKEHLRDVVYHEIVHASTGFMHDNSCPLMGESINLMPLSDDQANRLLVMYFKQ